MAIERCAERKPLLFTTTVRNPARIKRYLYILSKFEGQVLTDALCVKICGEAIRYGVYQPMKKINSIRSKWVGCKGEFGRELLTDQEVAWMIGHNPQKHKEAGFSYGWPSRFQTQFMIARELGFVYYAIDEKIEISALGKRLIAQIGVKVDSVGNIVAEEIDSENESEIFQLAMAKYHRNNPYLKVLNANCPLSLLLQVLRLIDSDSRFGKCGITRAEIAILVFWENDNAQEAYEHIVDFRKKYGYAPSAEIIVDHCFSKLYRPKKFNTNSLAKDYIDVYIRYMRITGLITLRGAGRFIDVNHLADAKIDYIIKNYSQVKTFDNRHEYFAFVSKIDASLLKLHPMRITEDKRCEYLDKWASSYTWDKVKEELLVLVKRVASSDPILRFINEPTRLEFLSSLAVRLRRPGYKVCPNYSCDDEGLPTSTAAGNKGDIECYGQDNVLVEVTMAQGRTQTMMECWPIERHVEEFACKVHDPIGAFVAPTVFSDSYRQFKFSFSDKGIYTKPFTIKEFITELERDGDRIARKPTGADAS